LAGCAGSGCVKPLDAGEAAFKLAVLLHDPPWKPWGGNLGPYRLEGCSGRLDVCIAERLARLSEERLHSSLLGLFGEEGLKELANDDTIRTLAAAIRGAAERWLGERPDAVKSRRSHERQVHLLLNVLAGALRGAGLGGYAEVAERAADALIRDSRVEEADRLASSMDRAYLAMVYGVEGVGDQVEASRPVYVNPFDPRMVAEQASRLSVEKVADYIAVLVSTLALLLKKGGKDVSSPVLLYSLAYSLLEPLWYRVVGLGYVPVADTRVPHHTVFDHIAASAMVSNWLLEGDGPGGCLAIVDLKSVQAWISEARRLRDIWAASWLASLLAWKTVEPLVEALGPDVLIQPPARLHPFHAARLLSQLGCRNTGESHCAALARLLGLPHGWPIDPTVPTTARLALPARACRVLREAAEEAYREAWGKIMEGLARYIREAIEWSLGVIAACEERREGCPERLRRRLGRLEQAGGPSGVFTGLYLASGRGLEAARQRASRLASLLQGLEPPLPLYIEERDVKEALVQARSMAERLAERLGGLSAESLTGLYLYQVLHDDGLWPRGAAAGLRASGRRSGRGYLELARWLYEEGVGAGVRLFYNCHVCGAGAAVVDGEELRDILAANSALGLDRPPEPVTRLAGNVHGERLCPYCLSKRMLRDMLQSDNLAEALVGLEMPPEVYERLGRATVDTYTSRTRLNPAKLADEAKRLALKYPDGLILAWSLGLAAPNRFIEPLLGRDVRQRLVEEIAGRLPAGLPRGDEPAGDDDGLLGIAEALVLEAAHDAAFPRLLEDRARGLAGAAAEQLQALAGELRSLARRLEGRRVYALVVSDGDSMGRGVLSGRLGLGPEEYARLVAEEAGLQPEEAREALARFYRVAVDVYEASVSKETGERGGGAVGPGKTLLVTPSYHQAVSRALAVQAQLDRAVVEALGGLFLYSGGDDATAVLPPAAKTRIGGGEGVVYPALLAAAALRRLYWGRSALSPDMWALLPSWLRTTALPGFNTLHVGDGGIAAIVPALAAYGRSTVVLYAGTKEPFWRIFSTAHSLLDEKDHIVFRIGGEWREKDALIVAGSAGAALLPHTVPADARSRGLTAAEAAARLLGAVDEDRLSASLLGDARGYSLEALIAAMEGRADAVEPLLRDLASRNRGPQADRRTAEETLVDILGSAGPALGGYTGLAAWIRSPGGVLGEFLVDGFSHPALCCRSGSRCEPDACRPASPVEADAYASSTVFQAINAARVTRSAR